MRIFISGGTGFIGYEVAKVLAANSHDIVLGTRKPNPVSSGELTNNAPNFQQVHFDLNNVELIENLLAKCDVCIHLAWTSLPSTAQQQPFADFLSNVVPSIKFAQICREQKLKKFIFCSSGGTVYGPMTGAAKESHALHPISVYGANKASTELALKAIFLDSSTQYIVTRVANPYGVSQNTERPQGIVGHAVKAAYNRLPLPIFGTGNQVRDYIHVSDVAKAFLSLIEYEGHQDVFNVGSSVGYSTRDMIEKIEVFFKNKIVTTYTPVRSFDVEYNVLDCGLLMSETGWKTTVPLELGLEEILSKYRQ